jgi:predicted amino acid dehydrogenase/ribosome-associated toxin RatA of RatAB toxin-antitoxin module
VSKIIAAPKWRIIRMLTKVGEFPSYIPSVKEAAVISKKHNVMQTRWRVQVDGVPISWVEEDTLAFNENTIYFKAIEGDLAEFNGKWVFNEHSQGTEVAVSAQLEVGIPGFKDFADAYIKKLVTRSFEVILEALEHRLISMKYASFKKGDTEKVAGFGIIGHLYSLHHLEKCLKMLNPEFKMPSQEFLGHLFHLTPSFKLPDITGFKSKTGQTVNGCLVVATFIPEMIEQDIWSVFSKVVKACKIAEKAGVGIVTLGGFTSIVAERMGQEVANEVDVAVTTGNTFTAAMAIDGVLKAADLLNLNRTTLKVAIIGGTGDIGSACARDLTEKVKQITITGRTKANLIKINKELTRMRQAKIIVTTDNQAAVRDADIVIACASASAAILNISWFKPGSIICDVGYPKNVSYMPTERQDILIFSGGLAKTPTPLELPIDLGLPAKDVIYGCFAEGIILALEKCYENFSYGRGNITREKIKEIRRLGSKHGFVVSDFYWGEKLVDHTVIERIKEIKTKKITIKEPLY